MAESTTVRQDNRFADAFLEPAYLPLGVNATTLPGPREARFNGDTIAAADEAVLHAAQDSKSLESDVFWVTYIGGGWILDANKIAASPLIGAITSPPKAAAPWQWAILFDPDFPRDFPAAAIPTAIAKTAVHELGHQLLRNNQGGLDGSGHRGTKGELVQYFNASAAAKALPARNWHLKVSIMSPSAIQVPMDNAAATIPIGTVQDGVAAVAGNSGGPTDMFYFYVRDVSTMRRMKKSPGK